MVGLAGVQALVPGNRLGAFPWISCCRTARRGGTGAAKACAIAGGPGHVAQAICTVTATLRATPRTAAVQGRGQIWGGKAVVAEPCGATAERR